MGGLREGGLGRGGGWRPRELMVGEAARPGDVGWVNFGGREWLGIKQG